MILWGTVLRDLEGFLIGPYAPTPPASSLRTKGFWDMVPRQPGHLALEDTAQMSGWVQDNFRGIAVH